MMRHHNNWYLYRPKYISMDLVRNFWRMFSHFCHQTYLSFSNTFSPLGKQNQLYIEHFAGNRLINHGLDFLFVIAMACENRPSRCLEGNRHFKELLRRRCCTSLILRIPHILLLKFISKESGSTRWRQLFRRTIYP